MTRKTSLIATIVIICAVILAGILYYLNDPGRYESELLTAPPSHIPSGNGIPAEWKTYASTTLGVQFRYPSDYAVFERSGAAAGEQFHFALIIVEDTEENRRVFEGKAPGREGPVAITIVMYSNDRGRYTAEQWIRTAAESDFKLSNGILKEVRIDGERGLAYAATGLYEHDNAVVARDDFIYRFIGAYLGPDDAIRHHFLELLESVAFQ